jgi:hypothetical protein
LVAYYRGLPLPKPWKTQLRKPSTVKALIWHFHRRLYINDPSVPPDGGRLQDITPIIWNAQVFDRSCLLDRPFDGDDICGDPLPADPSTLSPNGGEPVQGNGDGSGYPSGKGPAGGQIGPTITYHSGTPSPTCTTKCGTLCAGFYCLPNPTGKPPDFTDPANRGECAFKTTTTECNGSGAHTVCVPVEVCTTPTDLPTLTRRPGATPTGSCLASGAVSTCAMGPGGQPACITSTACTRWATTASPTTPSTLPSPVPNTAYVLIFLEEMLVYNNMGGDWMRMWNVYSSPLDKTVPVCDEGPVFVERSTGSATGGFPGFPPSLGRFTAQRFTCTYKGTEDKLGLLECDGVKNMWCQPLPHDDVVFCLPFYNPTMTPVVICQW